MNRIQSNPLVFSSILALIASILYLPGFTWGAPHATASAPQQTRAWGTDDLTPLGPLAEMHNILEPKPDRNLGYPLLHSFLVTLAYAPYLGYLWISGDLSGMAAVYPFGLSDPTGNLKVLTYIAHLVSVLMGVGIVIAAFNTGRILKDRRVGIIYAVLVMVSFPMFYYARTGNVDVPMLFLIALAVLFLARILKQGYTVTNAFYLGVFGGSALATKEQSLAIFIAIPFVLVTFQLRQYSWRSWIFWKPFAMTTLTLLIAFGVGSGLFVDPERYFAHLEFARQRVGELVAGELIFIQWYPNTLSGNVQLLSLISGYLVDSLTLPGLVIALFGIGLAGIKERLIAVFALPAFVYLAILILSTRTAQLRYLLPPAYMLALFSALAFVIAWDTQRLIFKVASSILLMGIVGLGLLRGIDLTHAMIRDSRYQAAEWLAANAQPGEKISYFGIPWKLPPLPEGVEFSTAIPYYGGSQPVRADQAAVQEIIQGWQENQPEYILVMPDYTSQAGVPYSATCPPEIYQGLLDGSYEYKLVAYFETPALFPWVGTPALDYPTVNPPIRIFGSVEQDMRP